jgi:iron-sulfur cluster repair protein YtfE (RIC family)
MTSFDRADPVIMEHILAQHRELHAQIMAVRSAFAVAGPPDPMRVRCLREGLAALREHLAGHFQQEESGGFLEESITRMPRLSTEMKAVLADHPALLAELDRLVEALGTDGVSPSTWSRVAQEFGQFSRHLVDHERHENAVVQQGYNEDLGLVD